MPISGGGPSGSGGAMTLLSTSTLAVDGTFDVAAISGSYNDLRLVVIARGTDAGAFDSLGLRLNNDSGANYYYQTLDVHGATVSAAGQVTQTRLIVQDVMPAGGATANIFGFTEVLLPGYASTTWLKQMNSRYTGLTNLAATNTWWGAHSGAWNNTAAVTRVQLFGVTTANLLAGSVLRIYGMT